MVGDWATVQALQAEGTLLVEDGNHGENRPRREEFEFPGVAFIRAADLSDGRVNFAQAEQINATAMRRIRKGIGQPGDILLSHKGTVGKLARVGESAPEFVCSPQTTFWRVTNEKVLDRNYLYALMRSPLFRAQLEAVQGETDMAPYVSLTAQRRFKLPIPPLFQQKAIGQILGSLDEKIELNHRMAGTLSDLVQALFQSWFVDFHPVRAKAEGRSSGLSKSIEDVFPAEMADNGFPYGWALATVGELFEIRGGNTPSTAEQENWDGPHQWATPKDLSSLSSPVLLQTERRITDVGLARSTSGLLPIGSLLLSSRAPIGYLAFATRPVAINQGFAGFVRKNISTTYAWAWCVAHMEMMRGNAGGSTFPEISKSVLRGLPMLRPTETVSNAFEAVAGPLVSRMTAAVEEAATLGTLRDALLPRLISGELRVQDANRTVAAA